MCKREIIKYINKLTANAKRLLQQRNDMKKERKS